MKPTTTTNYRGLICLDGPDATGKTTLANKIANMTGGEVIHLTWTEQLEPVMNQYRTAAINYAAALSHEKVVILERPWLCHPVYSDVYRDGLWNRPQVAGWKYLAETQEHMSILAMPTDMEVWLQNYLEMCETREELHGDNLHNMAMVYSEFKVLTLGGDTQFQPGTYHDANFEIYDYQAYTGQVESFVTDFVLPNLPTWS